MSWQRGVAWIGEGWRLTRGNLGLWVLITVIFSGIMAFIYLFGQVGQVVAAILNPIFTVGFYLGFKAIDQGDDLEVGHLFAGFRRQTGRLAMLGVVSILLVFIPLAVVMVIGFVLGVVGMTPAVITAVGGLVFLIFFALWIMALWFSPVLVWETKSPIWQILQASLLVCLAQWKPFTLYGLGLLVLLMVAAIPFGLGLLVALPVVFGSYYASYKELFGASS